MRAQGLGKAYDWAWQFGLCGTFGHAKTMRRKVLKVSHVASTPQSRLDAPFHAFSKALIVHIHY